MHLRGRHILEALNRRAKAFPVVGIVGPRQVGKTTFLKHMWQQEGGTGTPAKYVTFDRHEMAQRAKRAPEQFLLAESEELTCPLIIDEA